MGYSPCGCKELDTTEQLTLTGGKDDAKTHSKESNHSVGAYL